MNATGTVTLTRIVPIAMTLATIPGFSGMDLSLITTVLNLPDVFEQRFASPSDSLTNSYGGQSSEIEKVKIVIEFAKKMSVEQKEIQPIFRQYIEDHFWELLC